MHNLCIRIKNTVHKVPATPVDIAEVTAVVDTAVADIVAADIIFKKTNSILIRENGRYKLRTCHFYAIISYTKPYLIQQEYLFPER